MTLDIGPFLETVAPISVLVTCAFGIAKVIYTQQEHGRQFRDFREETKMQLGEINTKFDDLKDEQHALESRVLQGEMYARGREDAQARRRVVRGQSNKRR